MRVRITQIDGKLPNVALMKLAHWHKAQGHEVVVTPNITRDLFENPNYDRVYGSCIFSFNSPDLHRFMMQWPGALVGGTGTGSTLTVESIIGEDYDQCDYDGYPDFKASIGFTQRGCRLACEFCVVPKKEGKNRSTGTIEQIWRGDPYPRHILLLDNDFFGQSGWKERIAEIRDGDYKVCFSQGINIRLVSVEAAEALASIKYSSTKFNRRRLYTAWDNLKDERIFFRGVERLQAAGIPPTHLMTYMLVGFDPEETWQRIWYRFHKMVEIGIDPYVMLYDRKRTDLMGWQRWVNSREYKKNPSWDEYQRSTRTVESTEAYLRSMNDIADDD